MENTKLFAFWPYDQFPFFLCGEVKEVLNDGWCSIHGYDGMKFKYTQLMSFDDGMKIKDKVSKIKAEFFESQRVALEKANQDILSLGVIMETNLK